jgi:hypothetical protein
MENDLPGIRERQDLLEAHLEALEARIDGQEVMLTLVGSQMGPAPPIESSARTRGRGERPRRAA